MGEAEAEIVLAGADGGDDGEVFETRVCGNLLGAPDKFFAKA